MSAYCQQINEEANDILEISTRSVRVERGDLELFYPEDYEPDPVIECYVCRVCTEPLICDAFFICS